MSDENARAIIITEVLRLYREGDLEKTQLSFCDCESCQRVRKIINACAVLEAN